MKRAGSVSRLLGFCESLVPSTRDSRRFLREEEPDLVLVTRVTSCPTDRLREGRARTGIPVGFIPFSWET